MATTLLEEEDHVEVNLPRAHDDDGTKDASATAAAAVTFRRTKGRDNMKRLSDILSAYIPVRGRDQQQQNQQHQQPLLEDDAADAAAASPPASPTATSGGRVGYRTLMLLDVASLRKSDFASSRENLLTLQQQGDDDSATAQAEDTAESFADSDISGVALSRSGYAFVTFKESANILRLEVRPGGDTPVSKTCRLMQVKLPGGVQLVPTDIKVHKEKLFACGHLSRLVDGQQIKMSVMVRCSLDGKVEQLSKELPHPRFLGFDIDPTDDQLVVASPTPDGKAAQIFKMSTDFKRKLFKIQLSTGTWNRPECVACLGVGNLCWVTVEQSSKDAASSTSRLKHRLLSFPLRRPDELADQQAPTKTWMKVSSWKFEGIRPGRLLAVPSGASGEDSEQQAAAAGERLLMLNKDQGNIYSVSEQQGCSALTHPVSEGGEAFTAFCCLQGEPREPTAVAAAAAAAGTLDILATTRDSLYLLQAVS